MKIVDSNILKKSLADEGRAPDLVLLLWIIYMVCKTALGIVWIWEGLVPKILFPSVEEIEMVARTRLAWWDPASFIPFLGVWEVALGLLLLMGIRPRIMASLSLGLLLFFTLVLPFYEPSLLYHPYGAITKNLGLLSCSFVVILLAPHVSKSANILTKPLSLLLFGYPCLCWFSYLWNEPESSIPEVECKQRFTVDYFIGRYWLVCFMGRDLPSPW